MFVHIYIYVCIYIHIHIFCKHIYIYICTPCRHISTFVPTPVESFKGFPDVPPKRPFMLGKRPLPRLLGRLLMSPKPTVIIMDSLAMLPRPSYVVPFFGCVFVFGSYWFATVIILNSRAILRVDIGFYIIWTIFWALLEFIYMAQNLPTKPKRQIFILHNFWVQVLVLGCTVWLVPVVFGAPFGEHSVADTSPA